MKKVLILPVFVSLLFITEVSAGKIIVNTEDTYKIESKVFVLDANSTSEDFIDLEFGSHIGSRLRYDVLNTKFTLNQDIDMGGNALINAKIEPSKKEPNCDKNSIGRVYYNTLKKTLYVCNGSKYDALEIEKNEVVDKKTKDSSVLDISLDDQSLNMAQVFYAYDKEGGQVLTEKYGDLSFDTAVVVDDGYSFLASTDIRIQEAGLYQISLEVGMIDTKTDFVLDGVDFEIKLQEDKMDIPGASSICYHLWTTKTVCDLSIMENIAAGGKIRAQIGSPTANLSKDEIRTMPNNRLIIERVR